MRMSQPGPGGQANTAPWRRWPLPVAAGFVTLLADVGAGTVRAVTIGPPGEPRGSTIRISR